MRGYSTTKETAEQLGISQRQAQRLSSERMGGHYVIPDRHILAAKRARFYGRKWTTRTVVAALDLLSSGTTSELAGSERSRLKRRLREIELGTLTGQLLQGRVQLRSSTSESSTPVAHILEDLHLAGSGGTGILVGENITATARKLRLSKDSNGNVVTVEGNEKHRPILEAAALFAYGDSRESEAAAAWLNRQRQRVL